MRELTKRAGAAAGAGQSAGEWALDRLCDERVFPAVFRSFVDDAFVERRSVLHFFCLLPFFSFLFCFPRLIHLSLFPLCFRSRLVAKQSPKRARRDRGGGGGDGAALIEQLPLDTHLLVRCSLLRTRGLRSRIRPPAPGHARSPLPPSLPRPLARPPTAQHPFLILWAAQHCQRSVDAGDSATATATPPLLAAWLHAQGCRVAAIRLLWRMARTNISDADPAGRSWRVHIYRRCQWLRVVRRWLHAEAAPGGAPGGGAAGLGGIRAEIDALVATAETQVALYDAAKEPLQRCTDAAWEHLTYQLCDDGEATLRSFALPFLRGDLGVPGPGARRGVLSGHMRATCVAALSFLARRNPAARGADVVRELISDVWTCALELMCGAPDSVRPEQRGALLAGGLRELEALLCELRPVLLREALAARLIVHPALADCPERADPTRWAPSGSRAFGACDEPRSFVAPLWQICDAWALPIGSGAAPGAVAAAAGAAEAEESVVVEALYERVAEALTYARLAVAAEAGAPVAAPGSSGAALALTARERRALLQALGAGAPGAARRGALVDEFRRKDLPILVRNIDTYRMEALALDSAARGATTAPTTRKWQGTLRCICFVLAKFARISDELLVAPRGAGERDAGALWLQLQAARSLYRSYQYVWQQQMSIGAAEEGEEMAWGEADHLVFDDGAGASGGVSVGDARGVLTDLKTLRARFDAHIQRVPC